MTKQPIISVIVPCYNQGQYLAETLDSVLSSTLQDWECIIVNDGSTDNSADVAKRFVERDSRFRLLYQQNAGPSAARNHGVNESTGEFILFLDGDDKIESEYISSGVSYLKRHTDCTLFYCKARTFGSEEKIKNWNYTTYRNLLRYNSIDCCSIIRRKDFDRAGGFDENMRGYEDWDFFIRLLYKHDVVYQDERELFHYRVGANQNSVNAGAIARQDALTLYIYQKNIHIYNDLFGHPQQLLARLEYLEALQNRFFVRLASKVQKLADKWRSSLKNNA